MALGYRPVDRDQQFLLPPSLLDWLPVDAAEDAEFGAARGDQLPETLRDPQRRRELIDELVNNAHADPDPDRGVQRRRALGIGSLLVLAGFTSRSLPVAGPRPPGPGGAGRGGPDIPEPPGVGGE